MFSYLNFQAFPQAVNCVLGQYKSLNLDFSQHSTHGIMNTMLMHILSTMIHFSRLNFPSFSLYFWLLFRTFKSHFLFCACNVSHLDIIIVVCTLVIMMMTLPYLALILLKFLDNLFMTLYRIQICLQRSWPLKIWHRTA